MGKKSYTFYFFLSSFILYLEYEFWPNNGKHFPNLLITFLWTRFFCTSDCGVLVTESQYPEYSFLSVSALDVNRWNLDPDPDIVRNVQNNPNHRLSWVGWNIKTCCFTRLCVLKISYLLLWSRRSGTPSILMGLSPSPCTNTQHSPLLVSQIKAKALPFLMISQINAKATSFFGIIIFLRWHNNTSCIMCTIRKEWLEKNNDMWLWIVYDSFSSLSIFMVGSADTALT